MVLRRLHRQKTRLFHDSVGFINIDIHAGNYYLFPFSAGLVSLCLSFLLSLAFLEERLGDEDLVLGRDSPMQVVSIFCRHN
jgi:hypothetical protein